MFHIDFILFITYLFKLSMISFLFIFFVQLRIYRNDKKLQKKKLSDSKNPEIAKIFLISLIIFVVHCFIPLDEWKTHFSRGQTVVLTKNTLKFPQELWKCLEVWIVLFYNHTNNKITNPTSSKYSVKLILVTFLFSIFVK